MYKEDTIAAIATGLGRSAIGIIRISGPKAIETADKLFRGVDGKRLADMKSFTAAYGHLVIPESSAVLDEVIALVMRKPHTYTTEDTVELDCHGGPLVMRRILDALIREGIRPAEPGEFTRRAFLGGRIDMTGAEAVMDVINAENERALDASLEQLSGRLKNRISEIREKILYETAYIESALDDPENYSLDGYGDRLQDTVKTCSESIRELINSFDEGRILKEGVRTVIAGRPNVGKSSLLNLLAGAERAIVTDIEGTTRDTLEEYINLGDITLKLIDTAGIRDTDDRVERIGVEKALESLEAADLVLMILDGSDELRDIDRDILDKLRDKKLITLINKSDLERKLTDDMLHKLLGDRAEASPVIEMSALTGDGLQQLKDAIRRMFYEQGLDYNDQLYITNARHKAGLIAALDSLERVEESIAMGVGEDFYTIDLMAAYESLGEIIGERLQDDLADKIFSEFCMGK